MPINASNRTLPDWFTRVRTRQIALPRFQRFEAWTSVQITDLFNSILRDLPVGAALVLEIGDKEPFVSRSLKTAPESGERITEHLLDGQQRLTALWRVLNNNYAERTYFLFLLADQETGMPYCIDSQPRWKKPKDVHFRPFWANSPAEQWQRRAIPVDLCAPGDAAQKAFREWSKQAIKNPEEREEVNDKVNSVRTKFSTCNLPYLSLPVSTRPETALDVFIRMNTSATVLSVYDIVVAQVEAGLGTSLHDLVADVRKDCPSIVNYYPPEELALYAGALLQARAPTNATYLSGDFSTKLLETWDAIVSGISRTVSFLEEERIFDAARLPTDVVIPVLVALWAEIPEGLDAEGRARRMLRTYLWRAFFTNRYEKSTSSRALSDYNDLKRFLHGQGGQPAVFNDTEHPIPEDQELIASAWPKSKDRLARACLALALRNGGLDLADGSTVTRANLGTREYHHLFPDAHLKKLEYKEDEIYRSLNCALVTWRTNRNISDKTPEAYLAERRAGIRGKEAKVSEDEIKQRLASHLIPYDEMVAGDYAKFLARRAELIGAQMRLLCAVAL